MRSPEGHEENVVAEENKEEPKVEEKSLVNEEVKTEEKKEEVKAEEKKEEKVEEAKVEPLTLEKLKVPEGFELSPEQSTKFLEILNGEQSPEERANALLALHSETVQAASEASSKAWDDMQTKWKEEVKADPDIGGAKLQPALNNIGKLLDEFGSKELKGVFDFTGAGNNPHMIKFLNVVAEKLTEGNFFTANKPVDASDSFEAKAQRMFPSANKG